MRLLAILSALLLAACDTQIYDDAPDEGEFEGSLLVMWVGPGDPGSGDGRFVYVPDTTGGKGLTFTRKPAPGQNVNIVTIEPHWMYTDGGSIPRGFQPFRGLNPWGYAPAYMVHDWLFAARKCLRDSSVTPTEQELKVASVTFRETYEIMAETIKTLENLHQVSKSDVQPRAITWAVSGQISRDLWDQRDACKRLSPEDEAQVRARLQIGPESLRKAVPVDGLRVQPADVVARISF